MFSVPTFSVRLRLFLPVMLSGLLGGIALILLVLNYLAATSSARGMAESIMTKVSHQALEKTISFLDQAEDTVRLNAVLLHPQWGGADYLATFNRVTWPELNLHSHFGLVYFGDEKGNHWLNKRERDGSIRARVLSRLDDSETARNAWNEASSIKGRSEEEKVRVAALLAKVQATTWHEHDDQGRLINPAPDPHFVYDPRTRPWYRGAKEKKGLHWTDAYTWLDKFRGQSGTQVGVTVSTPVVGADQQLLGVVAIDIVLEEISRFLRQMEVGKRGKVFILDSRGQTIGLPDYDQVARLKDARQPELGVELNRAWQLADPMIANSFRHLAKPDGQGGYKLALDRERQFSFTVDGQDYFAYYRPLQPDHALDWLIGLAVPEDDFLGQAKQTIWRAILISLLAMVVVVVVAIWFSGRITHSLEHLSREAQRIGAMNLARTESLSTRFSEMTQVSLAFSQMKGGLREMVRTMSEHAVKLDTASGELSHVSSEMAEDANGLGQHAREAEAASTRTSQSMDHIANAIQTMDVNMGSIDAFAQALSREMTALAQTAAAGSNRLLTVAGSSEETATGMVTMRQALLRSDERIAGVATSVDRLTRSLDQVTGLCQAARNASEQGEQHARQNLAIMDHLTQLSREIGDLVEVVGSIADQTNMLGLNAAIEAAGAGDAGKGFAVVAGEVNALARQTTQFTVQITEHIGEMHAQVEKARSAVRQVGEIIGIISQGNQEILQSVHLQSATIVDIAQAMSQASQENRQVTGQVADRSQEIVEGASALQEISGAIAQAADQVEQGSANVATMNDHVHQASQSSTEIFAKVTDTQMAASEVATVMREVLAAAGNIRQLSHTVRQDAAQTAGIAAELRAILGRIQT